MSENYKKHIHDAIKYLKRKNGVRLNHEYSSNHALFRELNDKLTALSILVVHLLENG